MENYGSVLSKLATRYVLQGNPGFYVENTINGKGKDLSLIQLQSKCNGYSSKFRRYRVVDLGCNSTDTMIY